MQPLPANMSIVSARIRVTIDCPECASAIPVNGLVEQVLCGACQAVVALEGKLAWNTIFTYGGGEACMEHGLLVIGDDTKAMDFLLAFDSPDGALYRKWRNILLEVDTKPATCPHCRGALDATSLAREAINEGAAVDAFCPSCGKAIPIRVPSDTERTIVHPMCIALACETAPRGDLHQPETDEVVMFSCLGCGAKLDIDAAAPRLMHCSYCDATSYLPDALWLRLHPAQRKRPFHALLATTPEIIARAKQSVP